MANDEGVDEGAKLLRDIEAHTIRLQQKPPATVPGVAAEMSGTVLEFVKDVLTQHLQLRDWVFENIGIIDQRVTGIEEGAGTQILPEDAEKLMSLIEGTKLVVARSLEAPGLAPDVRRGLEELAKLAAECEEIVADATLDTDDDEGEEDEPEEGATDGAAPS